MLLAAVPAAASLRLRPLFVLLVALAVGVLFTVAVQLAFDHGRIVLFVYPLLALGLSTSARSSSSTGGRARTAGAEVQSQTPA